MVGQNAFVFPRVRIDREPLGFNVTQREWCVHACASNLTWERVSSALQKEEKTQRNPSKPITEQESHALPPPPTRFLLRYCIITKFRNNPDSQNC